MPGTRNPLNQSKTVFVGGQIVSAERFGGKGGVLDVISRQRIGDDINRSSEDQVFELWKCSHDSVQYALVVGEGCEGCKTRYLSQTAMIQVKAVSEKRRNGISLSCTAYRSNITTPKGK